ncbi:MAG: D-alanine--D-alanine ligase [Bacteroidetes bacterium GWF2_49_14]|nr:MAG: D-alanine--D-alanine ligase [Bacteroidetes bacterium GWF2_49_14]HBB92815.1 D-alanine--D-alanine ligase [Bacteroidales bacterium]
MIIGLTYDLRDDYLSMGFSEEDAAEFDKIETIIAIEESLHRLGHTTERIGHLRSLISALASGKRWDMVFNICEGFYGIGREAQVPALLDAYRIPYVFSNPLVLSLTLDKGMTKRIIRDAGIPTAPFAVVKETADIDRINLSYPLFVKPVAEGTGKGISGKSVVRNTSELKEQCLFLLERFNQPVLVESYLSGREFTVGITGTGAKAECTGVMEIHLTNEAEQGVYSYVNKEDWEVRCTYTLAHGRVARECEEVALAAWLVLGCEDGGRVDLRHDSAGVPNFIEVNPLAGMNPVYSDLPMLSRMNHIDFDELIRRIMDSAIQKIRP